MTVFVNINTNPYRKGTMKSALMDWALEKGEFTKDEFLVAVLEVKADGEFKSKMSDTILPKAWWNEFFNKHKTFSAK